MNAVVHHIRNPRVDTSWSFVLANGKSMKTWIDSRDLKTWQFALSYKWQDPALNVLEGILDQYYPIDVPWLDIGANLGIRSMVALSSGRHVFFFEPNEELNAINRARCQSNGYSNYTILPVGVSDEDGELTLYIDRSSYLSSVHKNLVDPEVVVREEKIPVRSLDSIFAKPGISFSTACIKIDTEGHELKVILGAREFIKKYEPIMIIEINEKGENMKFISERLVSEGYLIYAITYRSPSKILQLQSAENSEAFYRCNNFLFVKDKNLQIELERYCYR